MRGNGIRDLRRLLRPFSPGIAANRAESTAAQRIWRTANAAWSCNSPLGDTRLWMRRTPREVRPRSSLAAHRSAPVWRNPIAVVTSSTQGRSRPARSAIVQATPWTTKSLNYRRATRDAVAFEIPTAPNDPAITAGSTPRTGRTRPSSASSPSSTVFSNRPARTLRQAHRMQAQNLLSYIKDMPSDGCVGRHVQGI
jgi:hypothetical protein